MALNEVDIKPLWFYFSVLLLISSKLLYLVDGAPQVPCYFIFGDSLSDNGNNNYLLTRAKVNYPPYGIDFPQGPTGRFSNGRNFVDIIAELLGFENYIPAFITAISRGDVLRGVNYASGAAGILSESGRNQGLRIPMNQQLLNHQIVKKLISQQRSSRLLRKCIYSVGIGSNDYINNYFMPNLYPTSSLYTPEQYADVLIQQYSQQLRTLYNSGARKIVLIGLGMIGSTPFQVSMCGTNGTVVCVENINNAAQIFNAKLKSLVINLNRNLTFAKFIYIDYYGIGQASASSSPPGSVNFTAPCCEVAKNSSTGLCIPLKTPCQNRTQYVFWDAIHPTEASNVIVAERAYNATLLTDAFPYDINHLAQL